MSIDDRPTIAAPDDDPYLWLEEIEGERALAFVEQQNALTLQKFGDAGFAEDRDALAEILDRPDNIPYHQPARRFRLQSLEGCEQSARPVAANHAG